MKRIAIDLTKFMRWCGGVDFIQQIVHSFSILEKNNEIELFIFCSSDITYRKNIFEKILWRCIRYSRLDGFVYFIVSKLPHKESCKKLNCEGVFAPFSKFCSEIILYNKAMLNIELKKRSINIVFFPDDDEKISTNLVVIGYIPDFQYKYFSNMFSQQEIRNRERNNEQILKKSHFFLVNANSVSLDLQRFYNIDPKKILVQPFSPVLDDYYLYNDFDVSAYKIPDKYFMISNQFWMHKDHKTAFYAFSDFLANNPDFSLVCTGELHDYRNPNYIQELLDLVYERLKIGTNVMFLGQIPKKHQIQIMKNARAVIQPSLFEGGPGGGAVYNAVSLDIPVILSDITTNLELKGIDGCYFFQQQSSTDLLAKMEECVLVSHKRNSQSRLIQDNVARIKKIVAFYSNTIDVL